MERIRMESWLIGQISTRRKLEVYNNANVLVPRK